jgi:hypothetical protein
MAPTLVVASLAGSEYLRLVKQKLSILNIAEFIYLFFWVAMPV